MLINIIYCVFLIVMAMTSLGKYSGMVVVIHKTYRNPAPSLWPLLLRHSYDALVDTT